MSNRSHTVDAFDAFEDDDAVYVTPAASARKSPTRKIGASPTRKSATSTRGSSRASAPSSSTSRQTTTAAGRASSSRKSSQDASPIPDLFEGIDTFTPVVPSMMEGGEDLATAVADTVEDMFAHSAVGGASAAGASRLSSAAGTSAGVLGSVIAGSVLGSAAAGSAAGSIASRFAEEVAQSGGEIIEAASPKSVSPLLSAASPARSPSPDLSQSRIGSVVDRLSHSLSPAASNAISKFAEIPTSGSPLRSPRSTDIPVPGLTTPIANTPLAAASLTGAVKPTTQVASTALGASLATAVKSSIFTRLSPRRSGSASANGSASASRAQLSPRVEEFARSLALSKPSTRPPSPVRTPSRPAEVKVSIKSATEILEDMGMTPLRALVTSDDRDGVARYILAVADVNNGRFISCPTSRELSKKSASPCMPITLLVALDTENRPAAGSPIANYMTRAQSVTRITKSASASRSLDTPREARILMLTPQAAGVCTFTGDLARIAIAHHVAEDIEVGELVKVEDAERGGAMSGVELAEGGTRLGTAGVAPIVPLSSLMRNPARAVEEIVETTKIIKRRTMEIDAELMRWYQASLAAKKRIIVEALSAQEKAIQAGIVAYGKLLSDTENAVDASLCKLNGYLQAYDHARETDREFSANDEVKFATVIGNIEKFAEVRADLPNITAMYMETLNGYSDMLDNLAKTVNGPLAQMESDMEKIYLLLQTHRSVAGYDLISTGRQ